MESYAWSLLFYLALVALIAIVLIKKRREAKDTKDIDRNNQPKQTDHED